VRQFVVPAIFFESIAGKGNLYSRIWMYWLGGFVDEIFEPDFVEKQVKEHRNRVKESEIREIYQYGVQFLQQDFKIIEPKKKKARKPITKEVRLLAEKVLKYLNEKTGSEFSVKSGGNIELVSDRISEGYSFSDFTTVIDRKIKDWKGSDYEKFLRPITLFDKRKFENYLNTNHAAPNASNNFTKFASSIQRAQELIGLHKE
jgi:uncharacterized phage protein (TIGR02220 family)